MMWLFVFLFLACLLVGGVAFLWVFIGTIEEIIHSPDDEDLRDL